MPKTKTSSGKSTRHVHDIDTRLLEGKEIVSHRRANLKAYSMGRGVTQYVIFPEAAHCPDTDGGWKDIDNTLEVSVKQNSSRLGTKNSGMNFSLAAAATDERLVQATDNKGRSIAWAVEGAQASSVIIEESEAEQEHKLKRRDFDALRKMPRKLDSITKYENILADTDMVCHIHGNRFKDEFVLKSANAPAQISLNLVADDGIIFGVDDDGATCAAQGADIVFTLPPATVIDANGNPGIVSTSLINGTLMQYNVDANWLAQAAFPVTIDPIINTNSESYLEDNYVSQLTPSVVVNDTANKLRVSSKAADGNCRSFLKLNQLPELSGAYTITDAKLTLKQIPINVTVFPVFYKEVLEDWSAYTITWDNQPAVADMDIGFFDTIKATGSIPKDQEIDITKLVRKWYQGDNHGIRFDVCKVATTSTTVAYSAVA